MSTPESPNAHSAEAGRLPVYSVVIPTIGRPSLNDLLRDLDHGHGPRPAEVIIVDDRPARIGLEALEVPATGLPITVLQSGGKGPAAARNVGWFNARSEWIAFLDDDVRLPQDWSEALVVDLGRCRPEDAGSSARIVVDLAGDGRPTDNERNTLGLADAQWITADIAYRRTALAEVGGFDESFPRAYREDSDIALRMIDAGYRITCGERTTRHLPPTSDSWWASVRRQRGNADDAVMAARHGRSWRRRAGAGRGRFGEHAATTTAGLVAVTTLPWRRNRTAAVIGTVAGAGWLLMTLRFAVGRILPGPRTPAEIGRMLASSVLIPPAACFHRVRGTLNARFGRLREPRYVLPAADTSARLGDRPRDISDIPDEELGPRGEGGH